MVVIGERPAFPSQRIAPAFVPADQGVPDVDHGHADASRAPGHGEGLRPFEHLAAQLAILQVGPDGEHAQVPDPRLRRLQPHARQQRPRHAVAQREEQRLRLGPQIGAQGRHVGSLPVDIVGFAGPAGVGAGAAVGAVHQGHDVFDVGVEGGGKGHGRP